MLLLNFRSTLIIFTILMIVIHDIFLQTAVHLSRIHLLKLEPLLGLTGGKLIMLPLRSSFYCVLVVADFLSILVRLLYVLVAAFIVSAELWCLLLVQFGVTLLHECIFAEFLQLGLRG